MKKYKLKKDFPNHKIGETLTEDEIGVITWDSNGKILPKEYFSKEFFVSIETPIFKDGDTVFDIAVRQPLKIVRYDWDSQVYIVYTDSLKTTPAKIHPKYTIAAKQYWFIQSEGKVNYSYEVSSLEEHKKHKNYSYFFKFNETASFRKKAENYFLTKDDADQRLLEILKRGV